jgi:chromosome segregation ATPase
LLACCRERKKQKYCNLQGTVDELSLRLSQVNTLEVANTELTQRNHQLEAVVKEQQHQLQNQQETIAKQAQQLSTQAQQLATQAQQLKQQVQRIEQQDRQVTELRSSLAAASHTAPAAATTAGGTPAEDQQLNDQLALAVRAVLTGVSSMASVLPAKDAQQMQHMVSQLPDALLQQIRSCCREVALHLKNTEVKEQPHAIQVPCC